MVVDLSMPEGDGHTALSHEDTEGLIPTYIATRGDLFEAEERNITKALLRRPPTVSALLDDRFLRDLHKYMFGGVWTWAGKYRTRETNIGMSPAGIGVAVRALVDDALAWIEYATHEPDESAIRFHHRLVAIHPFPKWQRAPWEGGSQLSGPVARSAALHLGRRTGHRHAVASLGVPDRLAGGRPWRYRSPSDLLPFLIRLHPLT